MDPDKETRSDATLKGLAEKNPQVEEDLWRFRYPEEDGKKLSYEEILVEIPLRYGLVVKSLSTLSDYYAWARLRRRMIAAREMADQAKLELLRDPNISPADVERVAQTIFTSEALEAGNAKTYVQLAKLQLTREKHELEREKLSAAAKSKIDAGLDALFEEIKGNPKAEAIFAQLKEAVAKA